MIHDNECDPDMLVSAVNLGVGPFSVYGSPGDALRAGFDGVEIHIAGRTANQVIRTFEDAEEFALETTFHEPWWWRADGYGNWKNFLLHSAGLLPRIGYRLEDVMLMTDDRQSFRAPSVLYADKWKQGVQIEGARFQTYSTRDRDGKFILPFDTFVFIVRRDNLKVVLDTQHALTWMLDIPGHRGIADIPQNRSMVRAFLEQIWEKLGRHVVEIHAVDWDSTRGPARGRNVPFGEGFGVSLEFIRDKIDEGWVGTIVPEVQLPMFRTNTKTLSELRRSVTKHLGV